MKALLLIPCFNCAEQIVRVLRKLENVPHEIEKVLIVDNCSTDLTLESVKNSFCQLPPYLAKKITLVKNFENYGLGGTFKLAARYAKENNFTHLILFHGDDQADFKTVVLMVDELRQDPECDALLGARFHPEARLENYPFWRKLGNLFLNFIFSLCLKKRIYDIGAGVNLYKINSMPFDDLLRYPDHLAFDLNLLVHYTSSNLNSRFVPCHWSQRDQKSNVKIFGLGFDVLLFLIQYLRGKKNLISHFDEHRGFAEVCCE